MAQLTKRSYIGIAIMAFSFLIGLPAVAALGYLAVMWQKPLLVLVVSPVLLIASHILFAWGVYIAGGNYIKSSFRWVVRRLFDKDIEQD